MKHFKSFLAPQINEYLDYRKSLGFTIRTHRYHLLTFDRYLKDKKGGWRLLQPSFFLKLRANLKMESRSLNGFLSSIRVFFQFLVRRGYLKENPLKDIPYLKENSIIPFVFSPEQIDQVLKTVCKRLHKTKSSFLTDLAKYMAVLLLTRCGMRISEPLRLLRHHYRQDDGTLYIEKTKFKKDRLIPVPKAVMKEIENYLSVRQSLLPNDQNPYLLAGRKQRPLTNQQISYFFRKALKTSGFEQPRKVIGNMNFSLPTPHSLRHSFAINTLRQIKARGKSPQNALPVLAAYLGHSEYRNTIVYLKLLNAEHRRRLLDFVSSHKEQI